MYLGGQMTFTVRRIIKDDIEKLQSLSISSFVATYGAQNTEHHFKSYLDTAFSTDQMLNELIDPLNVFIGSFDEGNLVGYIKLRNSEPLPCISVKNVIEVEGVDADPERKGQGIGKGLLRAAEAYSLDKGFAHIWLGVWSENSAAIGFYETKGFEKVGKKTFMMADDPQVDYVMIKVL